MSHRTGVLPEGRHGRNRRPWVDRGVAVALAAGALVAPYQSANARRQGPEGVSAYSALLEQQSEQFPVVLEGSTPGLDGGAVLVEVIPSPEALLAMQIGDSFPQTLIAAAEIDESGHYEVRLDPTADALARSGSLSLTVIDEEGDFRAAGGADLAEAPIDAGAPVDEEPAVVDMKTKDYGDLHEGPAIPRPVQTETLYARAETLSETGSVTKALAAAPCVIAQIDCPAQPNCSWRFVLKRYPEMTAIVAGTNTTWATMTAQFGVGASSRMGKVIAFTAGNWLTVDSGYDVDNGGGWSKTWPASNAVGTWSHKLQTVYHQNQLYCSGVAQANQWQVLPVGFTGGSYERQLWNRRYPTYCAPQATGEVTFTTTRATTWPTSVKFSLLNFGLDASSRTGYDEATNVTFVFFGAGRYLCGNDNVPAGRDPGPGYLMADHTDR